LLDMAGIAVPASIADDGTPYGVTFLGSGGQDAWLAGIGSAFHAATLLPLGALNVKQPTASPMATGVGTNEIALAVVGAHLSGMPLNHELKTLGARFIEATTTAADYRLFALAGTTPAKPGLLRVGAGEGSKIDIETWSLSAESFGNFVAAMPQPLSIGSVRLADGRLIKGFLVEPEGVAGARDVSSFGGWRAAVAAM
jgi:allophanate hydrolase